MSLLSPTELAEIRAAVADTFDTHAVITRQVSVPDDFGGELPVTTETLTVPGRLRMRSQPRLVQQEDQVVPVTVWEFRCVVGVQVTASDQILIDGVLYTYLDTDAGRSEALLQTWTLAR